ncbi:MAG: DsbA family protein, partial [Candidatus Paceibacterota bacterium]
GLDMAKWNECFNSGKYKNEVQKDFNDGTSYGVSGTPSVFVNGKLIVGAQPFSAFKAEIDKLLK